LGGTALLQALLEFDGSVAIEHAIAQRQQSS
jgi:hypothetical protein